MSKDTLLSFPCRFPIKVMGASSEDFASVIHRMALALDPSFDANTTETRPSAKGNYIGLTIYVNASSQEHLDEVYRTLSTHPLVKYVL